MRNLKETLNKQTLASALRKTAAALEETDFSEFVNGLKGAYDAQVHRPQEAHPVRVQPR